MYECPNCAANLKYNIERQNLFCEACETVLSPYDVTKEADAEERQDFEATVFCCPQCGAQIISEDNEAAAFCSFCGASTILDSRISKQRRPEYILPFTKTKKDCVASFRQMTRRSIFSPKELKDYKDIESFRGIYMPYWMYDAEKKGPVCYDVRSIHSKYRGDYEYIEHYNFKTDADTTYSGVVFDASSSFSDNISQAISPFDTGQLKKFTPSFLSGFYADTSDVDAAVYEEESIDLVGKDLFKRLNSDPAMRSYSSSYDKAKASVRPSISKRTLVMLPVWFMSLRHKQKDGEDRVAYVAVNGQTGEACADLPIDLKKYAAGAAILSVLAFALLWFLPAPTPLITSIVSGVTVIISAIIYGAQSAALKKWETGESDRGLSFVGKTLGQAGNTPNSDPKTGAKSQTSKNLFSGALFPVVVSAIICGFLIFIRPVSDLWYYSGSIIMLFLVLSILIRLMKRYNMLTTRPLPQFSRTGGDDSAKQAIRD